MRAAGRSMSRRSGKGEGKATTCRAGLACLPLLFSLAVILHSCRIIDVPTFPAEPSFSPWSPTAGEDCSTCLVIVSFLGKHFAIANNNSLSPSTQWCCSPTISMPSGPWLLAMMITRLAGASSNGHLPSGFSRLAGWTPRSPRGSIANDGGEFGNVDFGNTP